MYMYIAWRRPIEWSKHCGLGICAELQDVQAYIELGVYVHVHYQ